MSTSWNWPGVRWWRVDLHTHSPASHDFGNRSDRKAPDWNRWIEAVRDAEIQAVAITDHNTAMGISKLQQAADSMEDAPALFPGVEITANDGVHLLLLMDPDCKQQHLDDLLSRVEIPVHKRGAETALKKVPPERIDRLALYLPQDAVKVSFKERSARDWRPLAQGSPGQQTAALLAFVLGYGSEPIILDQPKDDLDNTLIYELLVSRLRKTKTKRQVIVVTHNPNIVVHGDAELVLFLEAVSGQSRITCQGSLQERQVREEICRVMEGGREAFESRYQRIMSPQRLEP